MLAGRRVGIIGLDTSHATAFTKALNDPSAGPEFGGYKITAAYPRGSSEIKSSYERIPGYTEEVKKSGVEITGSIEELLSKCDVVLPVTPEETLEIFAFLTAAYESKKPHGAHVLIDSVLNEAEYEATAKMSNFAW